MTNWRTSGDVPFDLWKTTLSAVHSPLTADLAGTYQAAQPYTALALAQMAEESQYGTAWAANSIGNKNVLNLRPRGGDGFQAFPSWATGIAEWKARITDPTYAYRDAVTVLDLVSIFAPKSDGNDPAVYARHVEERLALWPRTAAGGPDMAQTGLSFRTMIVEANDINVPGTPLRAGDQWITVHDTANYNVGMRAYQHAVFVANGGGEFNVSFHFCVDDKEAIQIVRANQIAWHASDGCDSVMEDTGCYASLAIETCVNSDGDWPKTKDNLARLIAMIVDGDSRIVGLRRGEYSFDRIAFHQRWAYDHKYCSRKMLDEGSLPVIIAQAETYANSSPTQYAKPIVPPWLPTDDGKTIYKIGTTKTYPVQLEYTALADTPRKRATGSNHELIGPDIKKGETFTAGRAYRSAGVTYVLTDYGTRVYARDLMPKVQITASGTVSIRYE